MAIVRLGDLIDQPAAGGFLRSVVASGRFGTAYLLHGPAGVGKGTAAIAFARALLCEHGVAEPAKGDDLFAAAAPPPPPPTAPVDDACGVCRACLKTGDLQHPDLKFLFPVSGEERELDDTVAETMGALRGDPLHVFAYEKAASIRLSMTRELLRELSYQPYEAARRVVVVRDADRMREDQYSALLKSIEEPGATVWVLTTSRPTRLPATIRSRCQRIRFAPLAESTVARFLEQRAEVAPDDAALISALSSGSLSRALELDASDIKPADLRNEALALLVPAQAGDPAALWKACQAFMKYGKTGRERLRRMIEFHQLWLRDLLRARAGAPREMLAHRDREADIRRVAATVSPAEIRRRLMVLEEALRSIDGNVTADLTLFSTLGRLAGARLGEGEWPAYSMARWDY
jgi:DNA polymerase-3 subunit delta'